MHETKHTRFDPATLWVFCLLTFICLFVNIYIYIYIYIYIFIYIYIYTYIFIFIFIFMYIILFEMQAVEEETIKLFI